MSDADDAWVALASLRTLTLATSGLDGAPRLRMVVPRVVDPALRRVRFYTDGRSAKIAEIAREARVGLLGWQEVERVQWRLDGVAAFAGEDEAAAAWAGLRPGAHLDYATAAAPGTELVGAPAHVEPAAARRNFAVVDVTVAAIECLTLDPRGHRRIRLCWTACGWRRLPLVP